MRVIQFLFITALCFTLAAGAWAGTTTVISDDACAFTDDNTNWNPAVEVVYPAWIAKLAEMGQEDLTANYGAQFIWACSLPVPLSYFGPYRFTKVFYLPPSSAYDGWMKATADNCYAMYVNGHYLGGSCSTEPPAGDPLEVMTTAGALEVDPRNWSTLEDFVLDESVLHAGWNVVDCYAVNWLSFYLDGVLRQVNPGEGNPAGVIFAAQIQHDDLLCFKFTPQALNNTSSGKYVKLHIAQAPESWHTGWQNLLLNGEIAPLEAKSLGGAASAGALQVVYSRQAVEDWLTANVYNAGTWDGRYTFWVSYDGFYGEDNIKIMDPPAFTN